MSRLVQYRSVSLEVAAGVVDRKISLPHSVLEFTVPQNTINAFIRLGDPGAEQIALEPGGKTKFCFGDNPPSAIYLTAPGGDPIVVFGSQEVEPSFSPFGSDAGAIRNEIFATWPEHRTSVAQGAGIITTFGFDSNFNGGTMWGARTGTAPESMEIFDGRLCYVAAPVTLNPRAIRPVGASLLIHLPLTQLLSLGQVATDFSRVYWDTLWMQQTGTLVNGLNAGLAYGFFPNPGGEWVNDANFVGWGLFIRTNGDWAYAANRLNTGPADPDELVFLGISSSVWRRFDIVHLAPTPTRRARLLIYIDAVLRIEREWAAGSGPLPDYSQGGVGPTSIQRRTKSELAVGGGAGTMLFRVASSSFRQGQLQLGGTFA